jgi:hydrogenase expression/formation protein HypC
MCLAVPMKVKNIRWPNAEVLAECLRREVNIQLVPRVNIGDYVLVHAGFAIQVIDGKWAKENLELWEQIKS